MTTRRQTKGNADVTRAHATPDQTTTDQTPAMDEHTKLGLVLGGRFAAALADLTAFYEYQTKDEGREAVKAIVLAAMRPVRTTSHKQGKHATVRVSRNGQLRRIEIETDGAASPIWLAVHVVDLLVDEAAHKDMAELAESLVYRVSRRLKAEAVARTQTKKTDEAEVAE